MAKAKKLEQTKGTFKLKGLVKQIDRDNAYEESVRQDGGRYDGVTYRKLNIGLQTDTVNQPRLGIFSYEPEEVFMWNNEKRKKDPKYKGERIPFEEYLEKKEILKQNGTAVLQSRVGVEYNDSGKLDSEGMTNFEATELIYDNIDNDDGAYVEGQVSFSSYKDKQGNTQTGTNFNIDKFFKAKEPFDLEADDYEPENYFEQQFVYADSMIDRNSEKLMITGKVIDYRKNVTDATFVVNYGEDEDLAELAKNINKKFKFGDLVTAFGQILNQTVEEEVEDEDNGLAGLGGKSQPSFAKRTNRSYNRELTIEGILEWDKKYYTEEDFQANGLVEEEKEDLASSLGGKRKKKAKVDPFADDSDDSDDDPFADDGEPVDISDDESDMPF